MMQPYKPQVRSDIRPAGIVVSPQKARAIVNKYVGKDQPLPRVGYEIAIQRGEGVPFIQPGTSSDVAPRILLQNSGGEYVVLGLDRPDYSGEGTPAEQHIVAMKPLPYTHKVFNPKG